MQATGPAQLYATIVGAFLAILGLAGFFYEASFATGDPGLRSGEVLGIIATNGWTNVLHLACGLVLLATATATAAAARSWVLAFGVLFTVLAIWGFAADGSIVSLLAVNAGTSVIHLVVGLLGLGAAAASPRARGAA